MFAAAGRSTRRQEMTAKCSRDKELRGLVRPDRSRNLGNCCRFGTDFALPRFEIVRRNAGGFPLGVLG
jgi:hypothetical protein